MKNQITLLFILVVSFTPLFAQEVKEAKFTYDENFRSTAYITVDNPTNKVITTIEFTIEYKNKYSNNPNNIFAYKYHQHIKKITLVPKEQKKFSISIAKEYGDFEAQSIWVKRVRFSDGTIKEISKY